MMKKPLLRRIFHLIACIFFLPYCSVIAVIIGSNSAVAQINDVTFPNTDSNNTMLGFSRFGEGFFLQDNTTSCTFDCIFPVSGTIALNQGTLYLNQDMVCNNNVQFTTHGQIYGQGYSIELSTTYSPLVIPTQSTTFTYTSFEQIQTIVEAAVVNSVAWSFDGGYLAVGIQRPSSAPANAGPELLIYSFNGRLLTQVASVRTNEHVQNVVWHPFQYDFAITGTSNIYQTNVNVAVYNFNTATNAVSLVSGISVAVEPTFAQWSPTGTYLAFAGQLSKIGVCSWSDNTLTLLTTTTTSLMPTSNALCWSPDNAYIAVGFNPGSSLDDIQIFGFDGTILYQTGGITTGMEVACLDWMNVGQGSFLAAAFFNTSGSQSEFFRLYNFSGGTITEETSSRLGINNTVIWIAWSPDNAYLLMGLAYEANDFRIYQFNANALTFTQLYATTNTSPLFSVAWHPSQLFCASGDVGSNTILYELYGITTQSIDLNPWLIDTTKLVLESQLLLRAPLYTRNTCIISGRGNELVLMSGGSILVKPGGTLILEDLCLSDVGASNLGCTDSTGTIILRNCMLGLSSNFTFSIGSFIFDKDVYITGDADFIYTSGQASTINSNSILNFEYGTTFQYMPSVANKNLIIMTDSTSGLCFDGSTMVSSHTGLKLTTGSLYLNNAVTLTNNASNPAEGTEFAENLTVNFLSKSFVNLFGYYKYGV